VSDIYDAVGAEVAAELRRARTKHAPMRGAHEGYAVLLEEVDELWDEVKRRDPDLVAMRKEAIQVAAMGLAFAIEVCAPTSSSTAPRADAETMMGCPRCKGTGIVPMAPPCHCTHEAGDSPCPMHGMDEAAPAPRQPSEPVAVAPVECRAGIDYWQAARQPSDTDGDIHAIDPKCCTECGEGQPSDTDTAHAPTHCCPNRLAHRDSVGDRCHCQCKRPECVAKFAGPSSPSSTTPTEKP
jgi:hypothetical protein